MFLCSISVPSAPPELITKFKVFRKPWRIWNPDLVVFIKVIRIPASWPVKKYQALTCNCMIVLPKFRHLSSRTNNFEFKILNLAVGYYNFRTEFINLTPIMGANKTSWEFTKPSNVGPYCILLYFDFFWRVYLTLNLDGVCRDGSANWVYLLRSWPSYQFWRVWMASSSLDGNDFH